MSAGSASKFIFAIFVAGSALISDRLVFIAALIPVTALALVLWTKKLRSLNAVACLVIWLFAFIFILHLFSHKGTKLFSLVFLTATKEGALAGLFYGAKLLVFSICAFIILRAVDPFALVRPLERISELFGRFGKYLSYSILAFSLALRFIPEFIRQTEMTRLALQTRGIYFKGSAIARMRTAAMLVSAVFVNAFKSAESISMALAVKGYSTRYLRAVLPQAKFSIGSALIVAISTAMLIFGWRY